MKQTLSPAGGRVRRQHRPPAGGDGQGHAQERSPFLLPHRQRQRGPPFPRRPGRPAVTLRSTQEEDQTPSSAQDTGKRAVKANRT